MGNRCVQGFLRLLLSALYLVFGQMNAPCRSSSEVSGVRKTRAKAAGCRGWEGRGSLVGILGPCSGAGMGLGSKLSSEVTLSGRTVSFS